MKKYFFTGFVLLMPLVITIVIVMFVVNILTKPLIGPVASLYTYLGIFDEPFLFFSAQQILTFASKVTVLIFLFVLVLCIGFFARLFLVSYLVKAGEYLIHRIPVVNKIYKASQDIVHTIFGKNEKNSFSAVVLVPFPHSQNYSIGLVTNEPIPKETEHEYDNLVTVFIPGTPNPAMGFMLLYKKEHIVYLDMTVQQAFKFVVSCGVILPGDEVKEVET